MEALSDDPSRFFPKNFPVVDRTLAGPCIKVDAMTEGQLHFLDPEKVHDPLRAPLLYRWAPPMTADDIVVGAATQSACGVTLHRKSNLMPNDDAVG